MSRNARDDHEPAAEPLWELPLIDFIERASGGRYKRPYHFAAIADAIELAEQLTNARDVVDAPVQHGKTTLIEFAIAWILLRHPDRPVIYLTYAQRKAEKHSRRIRAIYTQCGGKLSADFNTIQEWKTDQGGGLLATSRDGEITGNPAVHVFFDDPYKDREEAESSDVRERLEEKFSSEINSRVAPGGSITIIASRWDEEDLSGVKIRAGYRHTHLQAIRLEVTRGDDGEPITDEVGNVLMHEVALCPDGPDPRYPRTLDFLVSLRDGPDCTEHDWESLYQGNPRPRNAGLFKECRLYELAERPAIVKVAVGCDFAYSNTGDRIAIVVLGLGTDGVVYVLAVYVWQRSVLENLPMVRAAISEYDGAPAAMYGSGPELAIVRALAQIPKADGGGIRVMAMPTRSPKYIRAGKTARRWNLGEIRVLRGAPWADSFIRRIKSFTGIEGQRDDEADALVSGHDLLMFGSSKSSRGSFKAGARCM